MKFYYTYVLKSKKDQKLYIGWTDNLEKRILKHNSGRCLATKNRLPFKLIYFEGCLNKNKAIQREKQLKTGFVRKYMKERI